MLQMTLNSRQARWLLQLAPYDFTIHYRKGSLNPADGLSRRPDYVEDEDLPETTVSKLMPTLENKVKLATDSFGARERFQLGDNSDSLAVSLARALSMQAITRSAARAAIRSSDYPFLGEESPSHSEGPQSPEVAPSSSSSRFESSVSEGVPLHGSSETEGEDLARPALRAQSPSSFVQLI